VPAVDQAAARDLVRAREDCCGDLMRARHRLSKLPLCQGIVYSGGQAWTGTNDTWLRRQYFDNRLSRVTFESDYDTMITDKASRDRLDKTIAEMAGDSEFTPVARRLTCLRGVSTLTAFALAVEIGDWSMFTDSSIGCFLGLIPSEHSSGASRVQGSITKTGNTHARRPAGRRRLAPSPGLSARQKPARPLGARTGRRPGSRRRRQPAPAPALDHLQPTQEKRALIANVVLARELAGWCWSLATIEDTA
jgi:transposase